MITLNFGNLNRQKLDSAFNESTSGGGFFAEGLHNVVIESIEVPSGKNYLKMRLTADGKTIYDNVFVTSQDGTELSRKFIGLVRAVVGTTTRAHKFFSELEKNTNLLQALTGLKVNIKVEKGTNGYDVVNEGGLKLVGVDEATSAVIAEHFKDMSFETYQDVRDALDTYEASTGNKIYRAWNKVAFYNRRPDQSEVDANVSALQTAVEAGTSVQSPATNSFDPTQLLAGVK